jgi:hypothetical protein
VHQGAASLREAAVAMPSDIESGRVRFIGFARLSELTGSGDSATAVYRGRLLEVGSRSQADGFSRLMGGVGSRARFVYEVEADGSESLVFSQRWRWARAPSTGESVTSGGIGESVLRQALLDALDPAGFPPRRLQTVLFFLPRNDGAPLSPPATGELLPSSDPVIATPVPTPDTGGLLVAGLAALGLFARRLGRC